MAKSIFINLPVNDLGKTKKFFGKLGFTFNKQFTNKDGACMVIEKNIYAMLLTRKFMKRFTKKEIVNAKKSIETLIAVSLKSRKEVDTMFEKAIAAGGKQARPTEDYGWMYNRPFEDLDGHVWEPFWMDPKKVPK